MVNGFHLIGASQYTMVVASVFLELDISARMCTLELGIQIGTGARQQENLWLADEGATTRHPRLGHLKAPLGSFASAYKPQNMRGVGDPLVDFILAQLPDPCSPYRMFS